jgi:hypothetical protein
LRHHTTIGGTPQCSRVNRCAGLIETVTSPELPREEGVLNHLEFDENLL